MPDHMQRPDNLLIKAELVPLLHEVIRFAREHPDPPKRSKADEEALARDRAAIAALERAARSHPQTGGPGDRGRLVVDQADLWAVLRFVDVGTHAMASERDAWSSLFRWASAARRLDNR